MNRSSQYLILWWRLFALSLMLAVAPATHAQGETSPLQQEFEAATLAMKAAMVPGPAEIAVLDQAVLKLPEGFVFVPERAAARFMRVLGNKVGDGFIGLILPSDEQAGWIVAANFENSGYIRDDDAKSWQVDELLNTLRRSTEEINRARAERGLGELEVVGWAEAPLYDEDAHRLVWSLAVRGKGAPADAPQSVNYNTYALGREGYVSLNLVTALDEIDRRKGIAQTLLAALEFKEGRRYQDFDADNDQVAEYGLAALVGGIAAKKLGLFALAAMFLAKFGKIVAVFAVGLLGLFGKRFGARGRGGKHTMEA
jgi:uncharacterized membrane-anchored protein